MATLTPYARPTAALGSHPIIAVLILQLTSCTPTESAPAVVKTTVHSSPSATTTRSTRSTLSTLTTQSSLSTQTTQTTPSPTDPAPPPVCRPGTQRSCSTTSAGTLIVFPGAIPRGNCRYGVQTCEPSGRWGVCKGLIAPAGQDSCDVPGDDADCNGTPNEHCECIPSISPTRPCGSRIGSCQQGIQNCLDGRWGACEGAIWPSTELCDDAGQDEDCDGLTDLEDDDCDCIDGLIPCTLPGRLGDCAHGAKRCEDGQLSECEPLRTSTAERCGTAAPDVFGRATGDEDCDGLIDEADGPTQPEGCTYFIKDADRDGYGAMGPCFITDPENATHGCFCGAPPSHLVAHMRPSLPELANQDCGDCPDSSGAEVYPGQIAFFGKPSACLQQVEWLGGAFDYDCSNHEERRYVGKREGQCIQAPAGEGGCQWCESSTGFWVDEETPACGEWAKYLKCYKNSVDEACEISEPWHFSMGQECR